MIAAVTIDYGILLIILLVIIVLLLLRRGPRGPWL